MFSAIRKNYIVGRDGKFEVQSQLPEGTEEIINLVEERDETSYLLSTEANRQHLVNALQEIEKVENYIYIAPKSL